MFDRSGPNLARRALLGGAGLAWAVLAGPAAAQLSTPPAVSQPVVQKLPTVSPGMRLNEALNLLARNPQDLEALIAAGRASLDLGDVQAAIGFFQRADTLWPGSARVRAGLAGAYALANDPVAAIEMFDQAEKLGPIDAERLADRGLAYDLVGDPRTAQLYYRRSLALEDRDETQRRFAISQAIGGDRRGMESTLGPLIQRQDKAAWRSRAFALAILGNAEEAQNIARQTLPAQMAGALSGYLGFMPRLTRAQQAAAANLGSFPRAAEIGRDDPRIARYAPPGHPGQRRSGSGQCQSGGQGQGQRQRQGQAQGFGQGQAGPGRQGTRAAGAAGRPRSEWQAGATGQRDSAALATASAGSAATASATATSATAASSCAGTRPCACSGAGFGPARAGAAPGCRTRLCLDRPGRGTVRSAQARAHAEAAVSAQGG